MGGIKRLREGRAEFARPGGAKEVLEEGVVCVRFVTNDGQPAHTYPANPNGSPGGITGLTTADGRVTIMMPHPERCAEAILGHQDGRLIFQGIMEYFAASASSC